MTIVPVPPPAPIRCEIHARTATGEPITRGAWVLAFTEVDPLGEQPLEDGDGVPLLVTERGLRTPAQFCHDEVLELVDYVIGFPPMAAQPPGGGLLIPQPRLN